MFCIHYRHSESSGLHQQIPPVCVYVCLSIDLKIVTDQSKSRWQKINNGSSSVAWREIHSMKFGYIVFRKEQPLHLQSGLGHPPEQVNISEDPPPPPRGTKTRRDEEQITNNDKTNVIWNHRRTKKNCNRGTALERSVGKLLGLELQSTLVISKFKGLSEKIKISVPRHIRFAELRKKINRTTTLHKWICNLTFEVRDILKKIVEKRRNCSLGAISPLFHDILFRVARFSMFKQGPDFHFEIRGYWR